MLFLRGGHEGPVSVPDLPCRSYERGGEVLAQLAEAGPAVAGDDVAPAKVEDLLCLDHEDRPPVRRERLQPLARLEGRPVDPRHRLTDRPPVVRQRRQLVAIADELESLDEKERVDRVERAVPLGRYPGRRGLGRGGLWSLSAHPVGRSHRPEERQGEDGARRKDRTIDEPERDPANENRAAERKGDQQREPGNEELATDSGSRRSGHRREGYDRTSPPGTHLTRPRAAQT